MGAVMTPHVRGQQPLHPRTEHIVDPRPKQKMEMVRHQAVADDAHGRAQAPFGQEIEEPPIVVVAMENGGAPIPAVENVIAEVGGGTTGRARHESPYPSKRPMSKRGMTPFSTALVAS